MGDRRPSWSCQTSRPAPQYSPQPHEAAWYRAFFVTAPPRNIAATNLQLAGPTSVRGFSERSLKVVFLQSLPNQLHSLFCLRCCLWHIACPTKGVFGGNAPSAQNLGHQRLRGLDPFPIGRQTHRPLGRRTAPIEQYRSLREQNCNSGPQKALVYRPSGGRSATRPPPETSLPNQLLSIHRPTIARCSSANNRRRGTHDDHNL